MMNKNKIIAVIGIVLVLAVLILYKAITQKTPKPIHYHAGFVIFDNGQKIDLSDSKYMTIEPCKVNPDESPSAAEIQHDKAHLHDNIGDVVHVHVKGAKWGDLFTNIGYQIDYSKTTVFVNGTEVSDLKNIPIKAYDSVVIFIGTVDRNLLSQAVTINHIKEVESKSETCGN